MIKKNDFIEIEFLSRVKESGKVFDTSIKEEAEKAGLPSENLAPLKVCADQGMIVKGFDKALEGKEINKEYSVMLEPEDAFGKRNSSLIKTIPLKVFLEKEVMPVAGMMFNMDGVLARIAAVSGGRVIVDFNNPLAGKKIEYVFKIKKVITDTKEKLLVLSDFFLKIPGKELEIKVQNEKEAALIIKNEKIADLFLKNKELSEQFSKKAKEILNIEVKIEKSASEKEKSSEGKDKSEESEEKNIEKQDKNNESD